MPGEVPRAFVGAGYQRPQDLVRACYQWPIKGRDALLKIRIIDQVSVRQPDDKQGEVRHLQTHSGILREASPNLYKFAIKSGKRDQGGTLG